MADWSNVAERVHWHRGAEELHDRGYAIVPRFLSGDECRNLREMYDASEGYRKTVVMERYRFGKGAYRYWDYPLPDAVAAMRQALYPKLVPIANLWSQALKLDRNYPASLEALHDQCRAVGQKKPTPLILKYGKGGYNTLHQDLYGEVYFPIQAAILLSEPNEDFIGGEFVLTQQVPRAQSRAIVLTPGQGDMILFATQFKPEKGKSGYYRVVQKHGVSEVKSGERQTMGLIFHDAVS